MPGIGPRSDRLGVLPIDVCVCVCVPAFGAAYATDAHRHSEPGHQGRWMPFRGTRGPLMDRLGMAMRIGCICCSKSRQTPFRCSPSPGLWRAQACRSSRGRARGGRAAGGVAAPCLARGEGRHLQLLGGVATLPPHHPAPTLSRSSSVPPPPKVCRRRRRLRSALAAA